MSKSTSKSTVAIIRLTIKKTQTKLLIERQHRQLKASIQKYVYLESLLEEERKLKDEALKAASQSINDELIESESDLQLVQVLNDFESNRVASRIIIPQTYCDEVPLKVEASASTRALMKVEAESWIIPDTPAH